MTHYLRIPEAGSAARGVIQLCLNMIPHQGKSKEAHDLLATKVGH